MNSLKTIFTAAILILVLFIAYRLINRAPSGPIAPPPGADGAIQTTLTMESSDGSTSEAPKILTGEASTSAKSLPSGTVPSWAAPSKSQTTTDSGATPENKNGLLPSPDTKSPSPFPASQPTTTPVSTPNAQPDDNSRAAVPFGSIDNLRQSNASSAGSNQFALPTRSVPTSPVSNSSNSTMPAFTANGQQPIDNSSNGQLPNDQFGSVKAPNFSATPLNDIPNNRQPVPAFRASVSPMTASQSAPLSGLSDGLSGGQPTAGSGPFVSGAQYNAMMQEVRQALRQKRIAEAHLVLSRHYINSQITPQQAAEMEKLLDQLAGTVIYSRNHLLEQPYRIQSGDTLESIATRCQVPIGLLEKINGISRNDTIVLGKELKVVRGPFEAVVDLKKHEILLLLQGQRYAGRFTIGVGPGAAGQTGEFMITDKTNTEAMASNASGVYGTRWLGLGERLGIHGTLRSEEIGRDSGTGYLSLSNRDVQDLFDILTVGSKVVIRR
jgi:LysM repeat protein